MKDKIDDKMLDLLQKNGRITTSDLAVAVGLSVPATADRLKKLVENGLITDFRAVLHPRRNGYDVTAFIQVIMSSSNHYEELVKVANATSEVLECHSVTGEGSHLLKIRTHNTSSLEALLRKIQKWPGVLQTHTVIVMSTYKEKTYLSPTLPE